MGLVCARARRFFAGILNKTRAAGFRGDEISRANYMSPAAADVIYEYCFDNNNLADVYVLRV